MKQIIKIQKVVDDIKTITIQGATNIAKQGVAILGEEIVNQKFASFKEFDEFLKTAIHELKTARATEPMLFNGLKVCQATYKKFLKENKIRDEKSLVKMQKLLSKVCLSYVKEIEKEELKRPFIGARLIKSGYNIATHCHSGSVVKILVNARNHGKKIHVYNTETRPLYQGRKTSMDLIKAGVPDTMITDDIAPFFIDNLYENKVDIDMVIIGSDAIKLDGSVYNKVGSFSIAMAAWHSKIPVYIVGSIMKIDTENTVTIEERNGDEIWPDAPKGVEFLNYAFDMVPAKFITGIITKQGIIKPKDIKKWAKKLEKGEY